MQELAVRNRVGVALGAEGAVGQLLDDAVQDALVVGPLEEDHGVGDEFVGGDRPDHDDVAGGRRAAAIEPVVTSVGDQPMNAQGRAIHSDRLLTMEIISMLTVPAP